MGKNNQRRHPRVFISYSHDSPEHADKVLGFANKLRSEGIDAILDQYEPWPEKGWAQWMLQQMSKADFVLVICTERYYKGVMDRLAPGEKRGIKYEWNLINTYFWEEGTINKRFLPVFLQKRDVRWIPDPFRGSVYFRTDMDEGYEELYRRLTNQPKAINPQLGKLKSLNIREPKTNFFFQVDKIRVVKKDKSIVAYDRDKIITSLEKASYKRPISADQIQQVADDVEADIFRNFEIDVPSTFIAESVMNCLRDIDKVAYIRFASVYHDFMDADELIREAANESKDANNLIKDKLLLRVYVEPATKDNYVVEGIAELYRDLNKYHILCGGRGLTVDDWQMFVRQREPVEVLQ